MTCPTCKVLLSSEKITREQSLSKFPKNFALMNVIQSKGTKYEICRFHSDHAIEFYTIEGQKVCLKCIFELNISKDKVHQASYVEKRVESFWKDNEEGLRVLDLQYSEVNEESLFKNFQQKNSNIMSNIKNEVDSLKDRLDQMYEEISSFLNCHFKIAIYEQRFKSSCGQSMFDKTDKLLRLYKQKEKSLFSDIGFMIKDIGVLNSSPSLGIESFNQVLEELYNESQKLEELNSQFQATINISDARALNLVITNCKREAKFLSNKSLKSLQTNVVSIADGNIKIISDFGRLINFKEHLLQNLYNSGKIHNELSGLELCTVETASDDKLY